MARELRREFFNSFLSTASEIKSYIKIYERQEKDSMIKFTRSACLYRIFNFYEFTAIVFDNRIEKEGTYVSGGYPCKLKYCSSLGLVDDNSKNILAVLCNSRNRLVHNMEMNAEEKERLENKVINYFKSEDEWFVTLVKSMYNIHRSTRKSDPMNLY